MEKLSVRLEKFSQEDFDGYYPDALQDFASSVSKARDMSAEEALKFARQAFDTLLPHGRVDTLDQYLSKIMVGGAQAGFLHFGIKRDKTKPYAFLWDVEVYPAYRGKGYGELAMLALENKVKELGLSSIWLNVFGYNATAIHLYKKLGYQISSMAMAKHL